MAKGSHKTWGGWETRTCWTCGRRITLHAGAASHHYLEARIPVSFCEEHMRYYPAARKAILGVIPGQLILDQEGAP